MHTPDISIISSFDFSGDFIKAEPITSGHINHTYVLYFKQCDGSMKRYLLQKINTTIFKSPEELMENISNVTEYIKGLLIKQNGDVERGTLTVIKTRDGKLFYKSDDCQYWRAYPFIEGSVAYSSVEKPEQFYNAGVALGRFQKQLADYPAHELHVTIPDFHNTAARYRALIDAVERDVMGRVAECREEIDFVKSREGLCNVIMPAMELGQIPTRVTHNDTKLNNVLMDAQTDEVLCLIDLDTVMPGSALFDFGDSIRFGASSAAEDEQDLSKVYMEMSLYQAYTKGYLSEMREWLTEAELDNLAMSALVITYEIGVRFLTDYLMGDVYFQIHKPSHNLDRARTQFKLVADMESKYEDMKAFAVKCGL